MKKIKSWEDLKALSPSKTHRIEVEHDGCAFIIPKSKNIGDLHYLSTHTFYDDKNREFGTELLQKCNFNVELTE